MWHLTWNIALNKARNYTAVTIEQLVISLIVAIGFYSVIEWSVWMPTVLVVIASVAYYINLVHIRFFGTIISLSQIKQFLFQKDGAGTGGGMLLQGLR